MNYHQECLIKSKSAVGCEAVPSELERDAEIYVLSFYPVCEEGVLTARRINSVERDDVVDGEEWLSIFVRLVCADGPNRTRHGNGRTGGCHGSDGWSLREVIVDRGVGCARA